jgi:hypothetical protein
LPSDAFASPKSVEVHGIVKSALSMPAKRDHEQHAE